MPKNRRHRAVREADFEGVRCEHKRGPYKNQKKEHLPYLWVDAEIIDTITTSFNSMGFKSPSALVEDALKEYLGVA